MRFLNLIRSVLLSMIVSFTAPVAIIGLMLAVSYGIDGLSSMSCLGVPGSSPLNGEAGLDFVNMASQITGFLVIFGRGSPVEGILILGLASSVAGGLFDLFNSYRIMSS